MATLAAHQVGRWRRETAGRGLGAGCRSQSCRPSAHRLLLRSPTSSHYFVNLTNARAALPSLLRPQHPPSCSATSGCLVLSLTPQLKQEELQLLRPVAARGQRETKKQALKRALRLQRAGVNLPSNVRLIQERERPQEPPRAGGSEEEEEGSQDEDGGDSSSDGGASDSDGEAPSPRAPVGPAAKRQRVAGCAAAGTQQQQQQQIMPGAGDAQHAGMAGPRPQDEEQQRAQAAAALREAALSTKLQLGIAEGRDDEAEGGPQPGQRPGGGAMPAGPGGRPRVVHLQRRPEIEQVR